MMEGAVTFLVRIENISGAADLSTPFAPGVWVLHSEAGPSWPVRHEAGRGRSRLRVAEALAEDGNPSQFCWRP